MANILLLKELAQAKNLTIKEMESTLGMSNGTIGKAIKRDSDLKSGTIELVLNKFPDVNRNWLLTGEGKMLNELYHEGDLTDVNSVEEDRQEYAKTKKEPYDELLKILAIANADSAAAARHTAVANEKLVYLLEKEKTNASIVDADAERIVKMLSKSEAFRDAILDGLLDLGYRDESERVAKAHRAAKA